MIDLRLAAAPVKELIASSMSSFSTEKPAVEWSTFALYACPWAGWILTCFDTEAKSARILAEFARNGPEWRGKDAAGRFNNNCPDFEYPEWRSLELPDWQSEYEEAQPVHVRDLAGKDHFIGTENETINGLVFRFLRSVLLDELKTMMTGAVLPPSRRRFGVKMLDSAFVEFWRDADIRG